MNPWPSAYTSLDGKTMKVWEADEAFLLQSKEEPANDRRSQQKNRPLQQQEE